MPYLPIDHDEKTSGGQPVAQTGVTTGGVGGGAGASPQGAPKTDNSYTNLTSYLQANAGNTANADAVNNKVFEPLSKQTSANAGEWMQNGADIKNATQGVRDNQPGATQSLLQQTYGNTWGAGGGGKAALDSALGYQGIAQAGQAAQDKRAHAQWQDPKGFAAGSTPEAYTPPQHTVAPYTPPSTPAAVAQHESALSSPNNYQVENEKARMDPASSVPFHASSNLPNNGQSPASGGSGNVAAAQATEDTPAAASYNRLQAYLKNLQ